MSDGVFLYNHIRGLPINVTTHNIGSVASVATAVFVGADERYCSKHANFMIHPTTMPNQEALSAERLQSSLDAALSEDQRTEDILRDRTSMPDSVLRARRLKDIHISPEEAVEFGLVSEIKEFSLPGGHEILQI